MDEFCKFIGCTASFGLVAGCASTTEVQPLSAEDYEAAVIGEDVLPQDCPAPSFWAIC